MTNSKKNTLASTWLVAIVFASALFLSWTFFNKSLPQDQEELHKSFQDQFQVIFFDFIKEKYPQVKQVVFHNLWTKSYNTELTQIQIFFHYSIFWDNQAEGETKQQAQAIFKKHSTKPNLWTLASINITDNHVIIHKPLVILND